MIRLLRRLLLLVPFCLILILLWTGSDQAPGGRSSSGVKSGSTNTIASGPILSGPFPATLSPEVRDLPDVVAEVALDRDAYQRLRLFSMPQLPPDPDWRDPLLALSPRLEATSDPPLLSFDGMKYGDGGAAAPSDVNGYVGKDHYIQIVNATVLTVYDKQGTKLLGPKQLRTLWSSTNCAISAAGDPIVVYDHLADRWLFAQFRTAFANGFCIAISTTPDPLGAYYTYEVIMGSFPDYFKLGIWPDAYYVGANQSGQNLHALDRQAMLNGEPLSLISFAQPAAGIHSLMLPSDLDGPPPAAGTPNTFFRFVDDATAGGVDRIELFDFHVDWAEPANSTLTGPEILPVANFAELCNFSFSCIRQKDVGQKVDSVTEWPMYRLPYRNFGDHETIVANHAVDVGVSQAGIRWYELRRQPGQSWSLYQQGTHAPDGHSRWMGSIAMDQAGNIALGYNVSSQTLYPSVRYAVRQANDPLSTLRLEQVLVDGTGSQSGSSRWSDYTAMTVDPTDGCTFWYTAQYYTITASVGWRTRIGKFKVANCEGSQQSADLALVKSAATQVRLGQPLTYTLTISNNGPLAATGAVLTDTLPPGVVLSGSLENGCQPVGSQVRCQLGTLDPGEMLWLELVVTPIVRGWLTNNALVNSSTAETLIANNQASASTLVVDSSARWSSAQSATGDPGETLTFTLTLTNTGNITDTFTLTLGEHNWPTTLAPGELELAAGQTGTTAVNVVIPSLPNTGTTDTVSVIATSDLDSEVVATVLLTSEGTWHRTFLPILHP